jgi:hypothetical protein
MKREKQLPPQLSLGRRKTGHGAALLRAAMPKELP